MKMASTTPEAQGKRARLPRSAFSFTLLTFCPPEPPERAVLISMSSARMLTVTSSTSGITATVAVLVCTRP